MNKVTNFLDKINDLRDFLDSVEELVARGEMRRAGELMVVLRERMNEMHNDIWLSLHRSGVGKV